MTGDNFLSYCRIVSLSRSRNLSHLMDTSPRGMANSSLPPAPSPLPCHPPPTNPHYTLIINSLSDSPLIILPQYPLPVHILSLLSVSATISPRALHDWTPPSHLVTNFLWDNRQRDNIRKFRQTPVAYSYGAHVECFKEEKKTFSQCCCIEKNLIERPALLINEERLLLQA